MAFLTCNFKSAVLGTDTTISAVLPEHAEGKFKALYLLHGLSDDHSTWMRKTSIERYACERGIAVIMPDAGRSFYTDMKYGPKYYTYISRELVDISRKFFNISDRREDNFIAGLSMGGYGAYKIALRNPSQYAAAASLSGALDIESKVVREADKNNDVFLIMGENPDFSESDENVIYLLKKLAESDVKPRLYQACGTEDFLYGDNIRFKNIAENLNFDYKFEEAPGGHSWQFWDAYIQKALDFFLGR